jgi:ribosomal protein S18 acetylase RimI-like enzyme
MSAPAPSAAPVPALSSCRDALAAEEDALVALGAATGLFSPEEADALLRSSLRGMFSGASDRATHAARVIDMPNGVVGAEGAAHIVPAGWTYLSADPAGPPHVWELWWVGVAAAAVGKGYAAALLADAEAVARAGGASSLLISTSSTPATARARAFYTKHGYTQVGQIPGFYGAGDDKVIFWKAL